jgi:hypothetical protein
MGGLGSGRRGQVGKGITNDYCALDVRRLQREELLVAGKSFVWSWYHNDEKISSIQIHAQDGRVMLDYRHQHGEEEWKTQYYPVRLDWTTCNYGGRRAWFLCPASGCGQRVALLYIGSSGIFACRHCCQLAYASQRESWDDRAARRADKIRARLKWKRGILNRNGGRPKGMHWKTYWRLKTKHDVFVDVALVGIARRLGILMDRLEG